MTAFALAQRFIGVKEAPGIGNNPIVQTMLALDAPEDYADAVPWCSAFVNFIAWMLRLPRSKSLRARSWLLVGRPVPLREATIGFDVVIFNRGGIHDPDVIASPGHVGFFAGIEQDKIVVLGGNQSDSVSLARYNVSDVLGVRRLTV
jgi:uncharacterized protein (TIGR02594 family)